jgi:hypothetical protein
MNFEKFILKNKNNIWFILVVVLVLFFLTIPNKVHFLYANPLGRAYLVALLIIIATYNRYLGLLAVLLVVSIYNSTDTITENFTEGNEEKPQEKKTEGKPEGKNTLFDKALNTIGLEKKEEKKEEPEKKTESMTTTDIVDAENNMKRAKESFSLMSIPNLFKSTKEPRANWSGKNAYGLPFSSIE